MNFSRLELKFLKMVYGQATAEAIVAGGVSFDNATSSEDEFGDISGTAAELKLSAPGPSAVGLAALLMLAASIGTARNFDRLRQTGHSTVFDIESAGWTQPITVMLTHLLKPYGRVMQNPGVNMLREDLFATPFHVLLSPTVSEEGFFSQESNKRKRKTDLGDEMLAILATRRPTFALVDSTRPMPLDTIFELWDTRLSVKSPTAKVLQKLAYILLGPEQIKKNDPVSVGNPAHLVLAFREGREPYEVLAKLVAQPEKSPTEPVPTVAGLGDLVGLDSLKDWGIALRKDLEAIRSGELSLKELPRGALISGPPGIGKSKAALAIAEYVGVPITFGSVARWLGTGEGHLGSFCSAMRNAFTEAATAAPCIMIIDEIDALPTRGQDRQHFWDAAIAAVLEVLIATEI